MFSSVKLLCFGLVQPFLVPGHYQFPQFSLVPHLFVVLLITLPLVVSLPCLVLFTLMCLCVTVISFCLFVLVINKVLLLDSPYLCTHYNHNVTEDRTPERIQMDLPAVCLLCLEQEQQTLEDYTSDFLRQKSTLKFN